MNCQASLSITSSWSSLKLMSIELATPSKHLILCCPLLLLPSIFPSSRVFSNESVLGISWPKYWSLSFSISPSNEYSGLMMDWLGLLAVQGTLKSLLQHHSSKASILWRSAFFTVQLSHSYMTTGKAIALTRQGAGIFRCPQIHYWLLTVFAMIPCCFYALKESASVTKRLGQSFSHSPKRKTNQRILLHILLPDFRLDGQKELQVDSWNSRGERNPTWQPGTCTYPCDEGSMWKFKISDCGPAKPFWCP